MLLTTEGLLFAGLSITVSLTGASTYPRRNVIEPKWIALVSVAVLSTVAVAAGFAWCDLFTGRSWPGSAQGDFQAIALLAAIVTPPVVALLLAINLWTE